jgi:hypothetical protein
MQPKELTILARKIRELERNIEINPKGGLVLAMKARIAQLKKQLEGK